MRDWGYEQVGEITEVAGEASGLRRGGIVWGSWGHRSTHVLAADQAVRQRMPDGLEPVCGIFARIGAIALNGMLDAQVNVGETAVIFGAGVVGLIVVQLTKLAGATVIAVDRLPARLDAAKRVGADVALQADGVDVAAEVRRLTGDRGADVCIEATGAPAGLTPRVAHRWNRQRLEETVMARDLITDVVPFSRASEAFEKLVRRPDEALQVVLQF